MSTTEQRIALVVLGMHRSGTSAVAGALVRRGASAGSALLPSTSDNANGYFEDARLVATSDALLASGGLTWDEPGPLTKPLDAKAASAFGESLVAIFSEFGNGRAPVLLKDPRACRLVPEWAEAMAVAGLQPAYVMVLRDPREVSASLAARDGLSPYRAEQLWLEHVLEAEHDTRGAARTFVAFDALLASPDAVIDEALLAMGVADRMTRQPTGESGVEPGLRRQRSVDSDQRTLADEVFAFANGLAGTAGDGSDKVASFDAFRLRWRVMATVARDALSDAQLRAERQRDDSARLVRQVNSGMAMADAWAPAPPREPQPRIYWRSRDADHSEDRSLAAIRAAVPCSWSATIGVAEGRIDRLRIDPDDRAGVFELRAFRLDGALIADLHAQVRASNGVLRQISGGLLIFAADDDPWIELELDKALVLRAADVPLEITFEVRRRGLPELLWSLAEQEALGAGALRALEKRVESLSDDASSVQRVVLEIKQSTDDFASSQKMLISARAEHAALNALALASLQQRLDAVSQTSEEVLAWARRRTLGYWWRRLRGSEKGSNS